MVSLCKRVLFQADTESPNEQTLTLSSTSNKGHYISLRPLINSEGKAFPFEWAFAGRSEDATITTIDATTNGIDFNFGLDTNVQMSVPNTHRGVIKTVWKTWESGVIEEIGSVFPWGTEGTEVNFREVWQPIDPSRTEFVELGNTSVVDPSATSYTLFIDNDDFKGLVVVVGRWVQGLLFKKNDASVQSINILRGILEGSELQILVRYGPDFDKFPQSFTAKEGEKVVSNGITWEVIESN